MFATIISILICIVGFVWGWILINGIRSDFPQIEKYLGLFIEIPLNSIILWFYLWYILAINIIMWIHKQ